MNVRSGSLLWPSLAVAGSALFWGTMWIPLREVTKLGLPGNWSGVLIYAVPALVALPLLIYRRRAVIAGGLPLLVVGLGVGACNALFAVALTFGEVGMIVLLFYLNPIWATLLECLVLGTPLVRHRLIGVALGLLGMIVLQGLAGRLPFPANLAEWMGLLAGVCWAIALVASNVASASSIFEKTNLQFVLAAVMGLVLVLILGGNAAWPKPGQIATALPWILGTAVFWIVPAMALSLWGAAKMSPARASMLLMAEVIVALISAAWLAGEAIGPNKLIGGALILAASGVDAWGSARADRKSAEGAEAR